jgi:hypothetical protein
MGLAGLEHDPEKWVSVFRKDHAPSKDLARDDSGWTGKIVIARSASDEAIQSFFGASGLLRCARNDDLDST